MANVDHEVGIGDLSDGDAFTARMDYYPGKSIEIGEIGVAHVWFQCYMRRDISKNPQNTALDTNSKPNTDPTLSRKAQVFFLLVDHTKSHII